jgi:predicted  nucleic acid-binding Zn-ribbon protein
MLVQYFRGPRALYNVTAHGSGIYFATDTLEILHNGVAYLGNLPSDFDALAKQVEANTKEIQLLNGGELIQDKIDSAINDFANKISDDGTINTFKELVDYAAENAADLGELILQVNSLKTTTDEHAELILENKEAIAALSVDVDNKIDQKIENAFSWEDVA